MDNNTLQNIAGMFKALKGISLSPQLVNPAIETERLINEIAAITKTTPDEVGEFYRSHHYSLEFIKNTVLLCGTLDKDAMEQTVIERLAPAPFAKLSKAIESVLSEPTWKDRLSDIPYWSAYYISYPFIWLVYWLYSGARNAWEDIWDC